MSEEVGLLPPLILSLKEARERELQWRIKLKCDGDDVRRWISGGFE